MGIGFGNPRIVSIAKGNVTEAAKAATGGGPPPPPPPGGGAMASGGGGVPKGPAAPAKQLAGPVGGSGTGRVRSRF